MNKEYLDELKVPELEEARKAYKNSDINEDDLALSQFYKLLVSEYFKEVSIFYQVEDHMKGEEILPKKAEKRDFFQKTDLSGFEYFYLSSFIRLEKLNDDVKNELRNAMDNPEDERLMERAKMLAVSSIPEVLMLDKEKNNYSYSIYNNTSKDGFVHADEIAMGLSSSATFDEKGSFVSKKAEDERVNYMLGKKPEIERAFFEKTGYKLKLIVNI